MNISELSKQIISGYRISFSEAEGLLSADWNELITGANGIRRYFKGDTVHLCSIVNARSGACSEDCKFCAQSGRHKTEIEHYPLLGETEIGSALERAKGDNAACFGVVTSGRGMSGNELERIEKYLSDNAGTGVKLSCSLGELKPEDLEKLKAAGMKRYHHNLETAKSFFPNICGTHSYEDRVRTVRAAKQAGLEVCCGGIIGLGETPRQRLEFAFELRELDVDSVPFNILNPVAGTALENAERLSPADILRTLAIFRFILPSKDISVCGGREANLRDMQSWIFRAGASGMMIGGYLTTAGRSAAQDLQMIKDLGLKIHEEQ